jgi:hypothetical protein
MRRKVLIFGIVMSMSVFGITQLVAADYHGKVPSDILLAFDGGGDPCNPNDPFFSDADGDGVCDESDMCQGQPGDEAHCGCPEDLVVVVGNGSCTKINDSDHGDNLDDSEGVPVGGGLLLLLGSALAYGATMKRRNNKNNEEK